MIKANARGVVVGASSDIGLAIVRDWLDRKIEILGTFRKVSPELEKVRDNFFTLLECDFSNTESINYFISTVVDRKFFWDYLVICPGTMMPLGPFESIDIDAWCSCFEINFLATMRIVHGLLPSRARSGQPLVLLFAGSGTNGAPVGFSAYTASKIALIKAVELLDAEVPDVRFTILGPGWVNTKIHEETMQSKDFIPTTAAETVKRLKSNQFNPMTRVVDCVAWAMESPRNLLGGRNFSVVNDDWGKLSLESRLINDKELYKLRRFGN